MWVPQVRIFGPGKPRTPPIRLSVLPTNVGAPGRDFRTWETSNSTHPSVSSPHKCGCPRSGFSDLGNLELHPSACQFSPQMWVPQVRIFGPGKPQTPPIRLSVLPTNVGAPGPDFRTWETSNSTHPPVSSPHKCGCPRSGFSDLGNLELHPSACQFSPQMWVPQVRIFGPGKPQTPPIRLSVLPTNVGAPGPDFRTWETSNSTHPPVSSPHKCGCPRSGFSDLGNLELHPSACQFSPQMWVPQVRIFGPGKPQTPPIRLSVLPTNVGAPGPDFRTWETSNSTHPPVSSPHKCGCPRSGFSDLGNLKLHPSACQFSPQMWVPQVRIFGPGKPQTPPIRLSVLPTNVGAPGPDFRTWETSNSTHPPVSSPHKCGCPRSGFSDLGNLKLHPSACQFSPQMWVPQVRIFGPGKPRTPPIRLSVLPTNVGAPGPDFRTWETSNSTHPPVSSPHKCGCPRSGFSDLGNLELHPSVC